MSLRSDPNVTPMIDVLLVLLIVFMLTVPRARRAIDVQLPDERAVGDGRASLVLEVCEASVALNGQAIDPARLGARLRAVYAGRPEKVLFVRGCPTARYQQVVAAMDSARGAGVRVLGISPRR
jgi:biopolymer transport protein ExbD